MALGKDKTMVPVELHLVSWNRPKMTKLVIETIRRNSKRTNYRLRVWDNASDEDMQTMLGEMADDGWIDHIIFSGQNKGLEFARQELLKETESKYFICIDNDCLPPTVQFIPSGKGEDWIERMVDLMERHKDYAAISCRTQIMIGTGNIFEHADENGDDIVDFPHPGGSLRIMRTEAVKDVGGWDRAAEGRGAEERYICGKLRDAGWKTGFATHIPTLHLFGTQDTDNWGYPKGFTPQETGHSPDVWHPVFASGDDYEEVKRYAGAVYAKDYFDA